MAFFRAVSKPNQNAELLAAAEKIASKKFDPKKYFKVRNVCVFAEHEIEHEGKPLKVGRDELVSIADRCNYRIANSDDFAVVSAGHTPTREEKENGAKPPPPLGWAGPFRIGKIGRVNPKYAIYCDEFVRKDKKRQYEDRPRRSSELWLTAEEDKRFLDPIAALGSETPRLDIGARFQRVSTDEGTLVRYQGSPVLASGQNTFVPGEAEVKKTRNQADLAHTVEAIEQLDWVVRLKELLPALTKLTENVGTAEEGDMAENDMLPEDELLEDTEDTNAPDEALPAGDAEAFMARYMEEHEEDDVEKMMRYMEEMDDEEMEVFNGADDEEKERMCKERYQEEDSDSAEDEDEDMAQYKKEAHDLRIRYARVSRRLKEQESKVDQLLKDKTDTARDAQLRELRSRYALDLDKERGRCLYAKGSKMTDEQFTQHIELVEELGNPLPHAESELDRAVRYSRPHPEYEANPDTTAKDGGKTLADEVIQYAMERQQAGEKVTFVEAKRAILERRKAATADA